MKLSGPHLRNVVLVGIFGSIMLFFTFWLMKMQIVDGAEYESLARTTTTRFQTIEAARGEIVDRYGRPFAVNTVSFDIVLDRAFLSKEKENEVILNLCTLLTNASESWEDDLPISMEEPFTFLEGYDTQITSLKNFLKIGAYSDVEITMYRLIEKYKLQDYSQKDARILAGIKYRMETSGFSISNQYTLAKDISVETVQKIKELSFSFPGVDVNQSTSRQYIDGDLAPIIIGQIGPIYAEEKKEYVNEKGYSLNELIGKNGIEKTMEAELRGTKGKRQIVMNDQGVVTNAFELVAPTPGNTVVLTLDKDLQRTTAKSLEKWILYLQQNAAPGKGREADAGAAVVIDVKTGEILAAVNYPTYDLNTYRQEFQSLLDDTRKPLIDRAFQGVYATGSTFKPCVAVAGLTEGIIDKASTVNCTFVYRFFQDYQPQCLSHHGLINVNRALRLSCNIFFYDVGRRLGIDNINKYATQFGFSQSTGIELPEAVGQLSSPEVSAKGGVDWQPGNVLQAAIGQLDTQVTPLQLANYVATLANDGTRMKAHLVKSIESYNFDKTVSETQPEVADVVDAPKEVFDIVREGMVEASRIGTASTYFGYGVYDIEVASKTGTPETAKLPNSTFIAYAPANDPQIAVAVVIEKGWHGYTGAPVAKDIFNAYFSSNNSYAPVTPEGEILP